MYSISYSPPSESLKLPSSGSASLKFAIGGRRPDAKPYKPVASSIPTPIGWPVKPFVFVMMISSVDEPKAPRSDSTSAEAEPPRGGVNGSCDIKVVRGAIEWRSIPQSFSIFVTNSSKVAATCPTSRRVGWKAELPICAPRSSAYGTTPLSEACDDFSRTKAAPPIPNSIPFLRASNGSATSSTTLPIECAPAAAKPVPSHSIKSSPVESSPLMTITRSHLPVDNQSSAIAKAAGVEAHALLIAAFGPLAPIHCANCACPIVSTWSKNRLSKVPLSSAPLFWAWRIAIANPGQTDANTIPVRSLIVEGRFHPRTSRLPALLTCSTGTRGKPASFSASRPAAKERVVETSMAATILGSIPYCSAKSK